MLTGDILSNSAARVPGKSAIVAGDVTMTYAELDRAANRMANALIGAGLGKGRRVAILSTNQPEYASIYFGAARSGATIAHLSVRYTPGEAAHVLAQSDVELLFVQSDFLDIVMGIRDRLPKLTRIVVFAGPARPGAVGLEEFLSAHNDDPPAVVLDDADPYCITFTGGTTGFPKAVLVSHRSRCHSSTAAAREFGIVESDVMCCTTPLFHVAGLYVWFQTGILLGCTMVFLEKWDTAAFYDAVERLGVTAAFLVPTQVTAVLNDPGFSSDRLANLRYVNFGGAPMPPASLNRLADQLPGRALVEQYGQSEAGPLTVRPAEFAMAKQSSVGRSLTGQELAILDFDGNPLPPNQNGEVVARGPNLFLGYDKDPDQTGATVTKDGWLKTGDVGHLDDDGFLVLVDRSKDMIISGGENVYPTEIENALYRHPAVKECAVFGIPDDHWGEVPAAHIVTAQGETITEDDLIAWCGETISRFKRPRLVKFVDQLPKTAVGKIQKNLLREPYWADKTRAI